MRELDNLYLNHNQNHFYSGEVQDCWEWWPGGLRSFKFGQLEFEFADPEGDGGRVRLRCGDREFDIEVSGKRIGMYGPGFPMTDYEMVDWFNKSMRGIDIPVSLRHKRSRTSGDNQ